MNKTCSNLNIISVFYKTVLYSIHKKLYASQTCEIILLEVYTIQIMPEISCFASCFIF